MEAYCFQAYADALEVIPTTLAENAGLNPIAIVTELRNRHALGERNAGINVRKVCYSREIDRFIVSHVCYAGLDLEHLGGGRRAAVVGIDKCDRIVHGNRLSVVEDRRLRTSEIEDVYSHLHRVYCTMQIIAIQLQCQCRVSCIRE